MGDNFSPEINLNKSLPAAATVKISCPGPGSAHLYHVAICISAKLQQDIKNRVLAIVTKSGRIWGFLKPVLHHNQFLMVQLKLEAQAQN